MIEVYYLYNTNSGRTAMKWLDNHSLHFVERKITKKKLIELYELKKILARAKNGFDDLINFGTKKFRAIEIDEMSVLQNN